MTTGYNICPSCKKRYSPKNESIKRIENEPICLRCFNQGVEGNLRNEVSE